MRRAPHAENRLGPLGAIQRPALALAATGSTRNVLGTTLHLTGFQGGMVPSRPSQQAGACWGRRVDVPVPVGDLGGHTAEHDKKPEEGVRS